ncbi:MULTISPECIES: hypothetical protein [unclassified Nodularia (in: cyanobacteria)]|uniref:hypothetical protein n=1 Tax=unclassified Nodularia (in: cyanobacteria) TaxID=2656917 RepID=UPI00188044DD|nr:MULTISPECIES: hypothetical protein [unclassified Nodularia (in: cyanobacteria)]MBE9198844.1 hypothetical protein [Nodularia sp. LEGE 06071]MCC2692998.1 hypothetical protein [Nodularia sp. LEGE 04288]
MVEVIGDIPPPQADKQEMLEILAPEHPLGRLAQPERLNEEAIAHIVDENNELWLSVASVWEIGIKVT